VTILESLDLAIGEYRLLDHPFYRSWRAGTLPEAALRTYAEEYGALIAAIDAGWETVGESAHAAEERRHAALWDRFAGRLGTAIGTPQVPQAAAMLATAQRLFSEPETAWGALYAFEAQQPATAAEKLEGLVAHYGFTVDAPEAEYFRVHAADYHEADQIVAALDGYGGEGPAVTACAEMAAALWDALTGIHDRHC
jgi:pyrroloquinoline quinone (PQQ) biosynthesis protein C